MKIKQGAGTPRRPHRTADDSHLSLFPSLFPHIENGGSFRILFDVVLGRQCTIPVILICGGEVGIVPGDPRLSQEVLL